MSTRPIRCPKCQAETLAETRRSDHHIHHRPGGTAIELKEDSTTKTVYLKCSCGAEFEWKHKRVIIVDCW